MKTENFSIYSASISPATRCEIGAETTKNQALSIKNLIHLLNPTKFPGCSSGSIEEGEERDRVPAHLSGSPRGKGASGGVADWSGKSSDSGYEGELEPRKTIAVPPSIHRSQSMRTRDENVRASGKRIGLDSGSTRRAKR